MAEKKYDVDDILRELNSSKQQPGQDGGRLGADPRRLPRQDPWEPVQQRQQPVQRRVRPEVEQQYTEPVRRPASPRPEPGAPMNTREVSRLGQTGARPRSKEDMNRLLNQFDDSNEDPLGDLGFLDREPWGEPEQPQRPQPPQQPRPPQRPQPPQQPRQARQAPPADDIQYDYPRPRRRQEAVPPQEAPRRQEVRLQQWEQPEDYRQPQQPRREQFGGGIPPVAQPRQEQFGGGIPPVAQPRREQFGGGIPPVAQPRQEQFGGGIPPVAQPRRERFSNEPPAINPQQREQRGDPYQTQQYRSYSPGRREPVFTGSIMQHNDRRSMSDAARMITTGGVGDSAGGRASMDRQPVQPRRQPADPAVAFRQQLDAPAGAIPPRQTVQPQGSGLQEDFFGDPVDREETPKPKRQRRETRGKARREEDLPEERIEQHNEPQGAAQVAERLSAMRNGLLVRMLVNMVTLFGVIYLVLAKDYSFPLPGFMEGADGAGLFLWVGVLLVAISAIISGNTVGSGMLALAKLQPSNDSYTALAVFACLIQGGYMAMQPHLLENYSANLYLPMAALMLLFNTLGKMIMLSRMNGSFAFTKGPQSIAEIMDNRDFARRLSVEIITEEPSIVCFAQADSVDNFLEQAFSESKAEDISKIIAPMTALAALVMALASYVFNRDVFVSASVFTGALCITAPLAGVIASNLPLSITNGKLARWGATLCGYDAVNQLSNANGVMLTAAQLFPKGSISIQNIQALDRRPIDQVIVDAASVLCGCDSNLSGIFAEMIQDKSILYPPENLEYIDGMGISAWVNGRRVLIGNRSLMMSYGVALPSLDFEQQYLTGKNEILYLANSGEAAAMYILSYKADKQMRRALELMCDSDVGICVYSNDPNLTAEKISAIYNFPRELLTLIPAPMHPGAERYMRRRPNANAGVIHNGSPASCLRTILAARSCSRCITLETALLLMSVVIGFAIATFFAFTRQMDSITWITLTVYQFFWLIIELAIPLFKH